MRAKWTFAILGVAIVPMAVLGLVVLDIQREGLSRAEKELEAAIVDEAATSVVGALNQASTVAKQTNVIFANQEIDVNVRTNLIREIVRDAPAVFGVSFFDEERRFVDAVIVSRAEISEFRDPPTIREQPAFRVVPRSGVFDFRYEALLEGGPVRGFLVVWVEPGRFGTRLEELSTSRFQAPDRVYLVNEDLKVIGGARGGHANAALPIFQAAGWSGKTFATPLVVTTEFRDGSIDKVGTIRTLPEQRWALVVERPTAEAFGALASARRAFLISIAAFAALAALAGLVVVRRVLGPIGALMKLVQRYARRDFVARSDVKSGDELEALGSSLEHMADDLSASEDEIKKRARIETNLRRYMPAEAAEAAALQGGIEGATEGEASIDLGGAKRRVTVVFADVVAFTGFAENATPENAVAFLNELFTILSEIVFRHDGMVDKFIGDCIMAVFRPKDGADGADDDVARALAAAEDMHSFVQSNLPRWREAYSFTVELGIGVSTGDVLMGNLGSSTRMEYTVIGDAVNVAARLEALARPRQTLTTQEVVSACPEMTFASLGNHALRGKAKPIEVFEVVT